jgi:hypothetical protein
MAGSRTTMKLPLIVRFFGMALLLAPLGCSEQLVPPGEGVITLGQETNTWTEAPAAVTAHVDKVLASGGSTVTVTNGPAPLARFSLGNGGAGYYQVTGLDAQGATRVWGRTLQLDPASFAGVLLPVFVGRAGAFSRAPQGLADAQGRSPPAVLVGGRYLLVAGGQSGSSVRVSTYDIALWDEQQSADIGCPAKTCQFESLAVAGNSDSVIAIGDTWAIGFDVGLSTAGDVQLPAGLDSWADVAGGRTIVAPDGSAYVVGATRASPPTSSVLAIAADGTKSGLTLDTPRAGAAATWVDGRGLVVVGGSASEPGAEILPAGGSAFTPLGFAADATTGAALAPLDSTTVLRAGGRDAHGAYAPTVELSLNCTSSCQMTTTKLPPIQLDSAQGFGLDSGEVLVVGRDASGATGAVSIDAGSISPVALREPRNAASAIALPNDQVAVFGGSDADGAAAESMEIYSP